MPHIIYLQAVFADAIAKGEEEPYFKRDETLMKFRAALEKLQNNYVVNL